MFFIIIKNCRDHKRVSIIFKQPIFGSNKHLLLSAVIQLTYKNKLLSFVFEFQELENHFLWHTQFEWLRTMLHKYSHFEAMHLSEV